MAGCVLDVEGMLVFRHAELWKLCTKAQRGKWRTKIVSTKRKEEPMTGIQIGRGVWRDWIRVHSCGSHLRSIIYWKLSLNESIASLRLSLHLQMDPPAFLLGHVALGSTFVHLAFRSSYRLSPLAGLVFPCLPLHSQGKMPLPPGSLPEAPRGGHKMCHPDHPSAEDLVPQVWSAVCRQPFSQLSPHSGLPISSD